MGFRPLNLQDSTVKLQPPYFSLHSLQPKVFYHVLTFDFPKVKSEVVVEVTVMGHGTYSAT
jgi:hypothetical protein